MRKLPKIKAKKETEKTVTYSLNGIFADMRVDVTTKKYIYSDDVTMECFEAWLYHKDYGVKELMFGIPIKAPNGMNITRDMFMDLVIANLETENYLEDYYDDYVDDETAFVDFDQFEDVDEDE